MADVSTLPSVELGVLGPVQVRQDGAPVAIPGAKPRAILTMLGLHNGSIVPADTLIELLWGDDPPRTAAKALQTHISSLRRTLGDGVVVTEGTGWALAGAEVDASRYRSAARRGRDAAAAGDTGQAVARFEEALALWRGIPELPDGQRGTSEKTRWIEGHAALVEDRAGALLATGRAAEIIGELEGAVADAPLRERRWGQLMLALYRAGRQGEALRAYQRARALLADELGIDPGPDLRRLEAAIVAQDSALEVPVAQHLPAVTRAVTFLLTDIEGSTAAWEADADAMAVALARHDELVEQVVTSRGGRLIKTRGEGDATFSVFERPSAAAAAAIELQEAIVLEPWALRDPIRIRVALHTGEVELRDGDYFGRAVNRAARLRSLAAGDQILCSGATAELVIDSLPDDVVLADLGMRELRNLARPEHVFELRLETADDRPQPVATDALMERPSLPAVLAGPGPFVGRGRELERLFSAWQTVLAGGTNAVLIAGEPGVGKTRLAGEWSQQAYDQGAVVVYGRCDEDLGAPYQPFAEALRSLVPCLGTSGLRGLRGVEALLALVPGLTDVLPDLVPPSSADPDTERYALFDAVVALLGVASASAPVVLILDDLHWAAKPTLLLLRHLLRFGDQARVQIIGTYRSTDLDRSHPLAAMLADLHRDGTANRIQLSGLDEKDVTAYVAEAGYDDEELARALASVTGGNPFFLIEALRHVDESGGHWDPSTLPQGVREAVSRRLSRLPIETNKALAAAAVVGSRFAVDLVEHVVGDDLVDAFDEASKAGIIIEEHGGHYRFNHALVRQSLLAELASVRRMRLHQRIAMTLENAPGADDELLAELAYHYFECAWAGNAAKAVDYCRRAADQAMARLGYEGAADLYDRALHALEEIDDELPDRNDQASELLVARCEALLAAGDVTSATGAVAQLQRATADSPRLAAWATCFDGELSILVHPERLDDVEAALGAAAHKLAEIDDAAGEAKAHTVRARCLARLGRIGDCEIALDDALSAARRAGEHRRVNAVLAGAPLAALWGPNPVPRAGGRCLDVVRLLRITTDSPAVEATSTRCQAVLEAFRGRAEAARRMIDSARRTVTELGLRHALLEVEQFAGIVELVVDDPVAAEPHLRQAYNGFRRMGLDADTAETAALLGRACLALGQEAEADELCTESERLAGHALKPAMAWRMLRAQLLSRRGDHDEARRSAEAAVALAERTDALVDHGDACLALATVLGTAGDIGGSRAAAERAIDLYERKGAAALAEKARRLLGDRTVPPAPAPPEVPSVELDNAAVQASKRVMAAIDREVWDEFERLFAPEGSVESRRKVVGFKPTEFRSDEVIHQTRRDLETGIMRASLVVIAVRGERVALARMTLGTADVSPGAPQDEFLYLYGVDEEGRITLQVWFDLDDVDAAIAELDAMHARFEEVPRLEGRRLDNAASQQGWRLVAQLAAGDQDALAEMLAEDLSIDDRRRLVGSGVLDGRDAGMASMRAIAEVFTTNATPTDIAIRGRNLLLGRLSFSGRNEGPEAFLSEMLTVNEINDDEQLVAIVAFEVDDFDAALGELDARYLAGEAATHARTWSVIAGAYAALNRHEIAATTPDFATIDHRRGTKFAPGDLIAYIRATWDLAQDGSTYIEAVHRLNNLGAVVTHVTHGSSREGFDAEWREVFLLTVEGDLLSRCELFDESDLDAALARFEQLGRPAPRLENAASRMYERLWESFGARDWQAITEMVADNFSSDDRRRVVNAGIRHGRGADIEDLQAAADIGFTITMVGVAATRGDRLALARVRGSGSDPEGIQDDAPNVVEIDADGRIAAVVVFDLDDFDDAIAELDARYLAGEAARYAHTWSVITRAYAALNRREMLPTAPDWVNIDHRHGMSFAPGELPALLASWNLAPDLSSSIEVVHRLNNRGAVVSSASHETSREGVNAEWRAICLLTIDGDLIDRLEVFDEGDLDAALARFEELQPQTRRLENAASQAAERLRTCFAARDWDGLAEILAEDILADDRRRIVGTGIRRGRQANVVDIRVGADVGTEDITSTAIATRGERILLDRARFSASDRQPEGLNSELLRIVEVDDDNRMTSCLMFDVDDLGSAVAELDARYLAGEAAAHAHTWSVIMRASWSLIRHELPPTTPDWVNLDHRRAIAVAPGDMTAYIRAMWDVEQDLRTYIEAVHRLNNLGAVFTQVLNGTSQEGFEAEWRIVELMTVEGDLISRGEIFDEADIDAAIAQFDQLSRPAPRLENAASRADERAGAYFAARDWDSVTEILADDFYSDDRRPVVNSGIQHGRDVAIANLQAMAELGIMFAAPCPIATRGGRLVLSRGRWSWSDQTAGAFHTEALSILEINADERFAAYVWFDANDFDAAIAELDARYLAGEAAAHADTWSVITGGHAALNRHEMPPIASDCVSIDHRRGAAFAPGELLAYLQAGRDLDQNIRTYVEVVHRLSDLGAVCTHVGHGVSHEGFDAEWRGIDLLTVEGDMVNRCETFDEADLDTALARFDRLSQPARLLENTASRATERLCICFAARDWAQMAETMANDVVTVDHRRVVNGGVIHGRELQTASLRASFEAGVESFTSTVIATRGERLALTCLHGTFRGLHGADVLNIVELDADNRIAAGALFDPDDFEAAIAELDARYLAGEAAAYAHTWTVFTRSVAALNRQELFATTPDWVNIDHRRGPSFAPGEMPALIGTAWNHSSDLGNFIEAVHRLNDFGGVVTHVARETTQEGFHAEWRVISFITLEGDLVNRSEVFDETDLDAAIARFDELSRPALKNAASQAFGRIPGYVEARDWDALAKLSAENISVDDRRRVVNAGIRNGRDAAIADLQAATEVGFTLKMVSVIATRGARLALIGVRGTGLDPEAIATDAPQIIEIDSDGLIAAIVVFDPEDIDAAFAELDARYLAGEAAAHAQTWSVITDTCAAFNRHELAGANWLNIDHRRGALFTSSNMGEYIRVSRELTPNLSIHIEAVHTLSSSGAVVTDRAHDTSSDGFDAEWRMIQLLTVQGGRIDRCEIFDESDVDAALARFDELRLQPRRLENVAARAYEHFFACYASRDWAALATILTEDSYLEDRRRGVNAGRWDRRDVFIENFRATADFTLDNLGVIATRGERLLLGRFRSSPSDRAYEMFYSEALCLDQIDTDERIQAIVIFDLEDISAAFAELDARYLAGEAAAHAHTWSVIARTSAAFNRRELPAADWVGIDHRRGTSFASSEMNANLRAFWDLTPDFSVHIEAVHRLSARGAVVTDVANGTSQAGFDAEWRMVNIS